MKVLYVQLLLEKNEHFSTPVWVYPWELPVFYAAHARSGVTELGRRAFEKKVAPRADIEYDRLQNKYKGPEGGDTSYVSTVYGPGPVGMRKLQEAMQAAVAETAAWVAAEKASPTEPVPVQAPEFESPFGNIPELSNAELGVETQADLRDFVGGGETTVEAAA